MDHLPPPPPPPPQPSPPPSIVLLSTSSKHSDGRTGGLIQARDGIGLSEPTIGESEATAIDERQEKYMTGWGEHVTLCICRVGTAACHVWQSDMEAMSDEKFKSVFT